MVPRTERVFKLKLAIALSADTDGVGGFVQERTGADLRPRSHHQVGVQLTSLNAAAGSSRPGDGPCRPVAAGACVSAVRLGMANPQGAKVACSTAQHQP